MARKPRIWYPGATYHITSRGNRKSTLFYDQEDHHTYLNLLQKANFYYPFHLHAYCLMVNHVHLHLETIDHHIKDIMKIVNTRYAMYFNKKYELVGHVFQGRYGAKLIESKYYQLEVSRYIHLNPVDAKITKSPLDYEWSSYRVYVGQECNPFIKTDKILSYFSEPVVDNYRLFVEEKEERCKQK